MTTVEVPNAVALGAVLPNGAPFAYTINFRNSSAGWIVHMSGGGWAFLKNTTRRGEDGEDGSDREPRMQSDGIDVSSRNNGGSNGGSATGQLGSCYGICDGIMSNDPAINPDFAHWNKVFIPIGDRTAFTADRRDAAPPLFRGKRNLDATLGDLMVRYNMSGASDVVLTGGSSGGHATYLQCDRVGAFVAVHAPGARYACLADAGFFIKHDDETGAPAATNEEFAESFYAWNSSAAVNQECIAHYAARGTPEKCIFAQHVLPFIKSRLFVMQNLFDSWQLANILGLRCATYNKDLTGCGAADMAAVQDYGADMRMLLAGAIANHAVGVFAPSCIAHCQSVENEHPQALWHWPGRWGINGSTAGLADGAMHYPRETFGDWYFGRSAATTTTAAGVAAPPPHTVEQLCDWGPSCNPLCPLFT